MKIGLKSTCAVCCYIRSSGLASVNTRKFKKIWQKSLMPRTLHRLRFIHGTWVTDGTHQTSILAPSLVSRRRKNQCQVSVARMWQFASRRRLLQISCHLYASHGAQRYGNYWVQDCQLYLWLVTALQLRGYGPHSLQSRSRAQWFPSLWAP
jgi:hypothetical protein